MPMGLRLRFSIPWPGSVNPEFFLAQRYIYHSIECFSTSEFAVSTRVLRNETASNRSDHGNDFVVRLLSNWDDSWHVTMYSVQFLGNRGLNSQSAMHAFDKASGVIFYSQVGINGVACWNSAKRFNAENHAVIARNDQKMIYPGDLNVMQAELENMKNMKINFFLESVHRWIRTERFGWWRTQCLDSSTVVWIQTNTISAFGVRKWVTQSRELSASPEDSNGKQNAISFGGMRISDLTWRLFWFNY